jgi:hypothetical protein
VRVVSEFLQRIRRSADAHVRLLSDPAVEQNGHSGFTGQLQHVGLHDCSGSSPALVIGFARVCAKPFMLSIQHSLCPGRAK